jgi:CheY-like chemotaxis protein
MNTSGPIIFGEDDEDDILVLKKIFEDFNYHNELKFSTTGKTLLEYLTTTKDEPFIIFADINLPLINGLELRQRINENESLRKKSIPFIFLSTTAHLQAINKAYELTVQGYFQKPITVSDLEKMIKLIIDYWKICKHPSNKRIFKSNFNIEGL